MISTAPRLTGLGESMMIRGLLGEYLTFSSLKLGAGHQPGDVKNVTAMASPIFRVPISLFDNDTDGYIHLSGTFNNSEIPEAFEWKELGVYCFPEVHSEFTGNGSTKTFTIAAKPASVYRAFTGATVVTVSSYDSETGNVTLATAPASGTKVTVAYPANEEVLYAYASDERGEMLRPATGTGVAVEQKISVLVAVGEAEHVTAALVAESLYAPKEDFDAHVANHSNPHAVTKAQVGLGNVLNLAPQDMVPGMTLPSSMTLPASGDTLKVLAGKQYRTTEALAAHMAAADPYNIMNNFAIGWYTGDGTKKRKIELPFTPRLVLVIEAHGETSDDVFSQVAGGGVYGGMAVTGRALVSRSCSDQTHEVEWSETHTAMMITDGGFWINYYSSYGVYTNYSGLTYRYLAIK